MEFGATDTSDNSAVIHYLALSHAKQKYLAVDHSKLNNVSFTSVIPLNELDGIILDTEFSPEWKDFLDKNNVRYYCPSVTAHHYEQYSSQKEPE